MACRSTLLGQSLEVLLGVGTHCLLPSYSSVRTSHWLETALLSLSLDLQSLTFILLLLSILQHFLLSLGETHLCPTLATPHWTWLLLSAVLGRVDHVAKSLLTEGLGQSVVASSDSSGGDLLDSISVGMQLLLGLSLRENTDRTEGRSFLSVD